MRSFLISPHDLFVWEVISFEKAKELLETTDTEIFEVETTEDNAWLVNCLEDLAYADQLKESYICIESSFKEIYK